MSRLDAVEDNVPRPPCPQSLPKDRGPSNRRPGVTPYAAVRYIQYVHCQLGSTNGPFPRRSGAPKRSRPHRLGRLKLLRTGRAAQAVVCRGNRGERVPNLSSRAATALDPLSHPSRRMPSPTLLAAFLTPTSPPPLSPTLINSGFIPGRSGQRQQAGELPASGPIVLSPLHSCAADWLTDGLTD